MYSQGVSAVPSLAVTLVPGPCSRHVKGGDNAIIPCRQPHWVPDIPRCNYAFPHKCVSVAHFCIVTSSLLLIDLRTPSVAIA